MNEVRQKAEELFSTFHDFEISKMSFINNELLIRFIVPWGELWEQESFQLYIRFINCNSMELSYFECTGLGEDKSTASCFDISNFDIYINRFEKIKHNYYHFHCGCFSEANDIGGGTLQIKFNSLDFEITDKNYKIIEFDTYLKWHEQWWDYLREQ